MVELKSYPRQRKEGGRIVKTPNELLITALMRGIAANGKEVLPG
jgi:hypothetical protein